MPKCQFFSVTLHLERCETKMKNQLNKTFWLTLMVVAALLALFYIPRISVGDTMLRRVNILSDVQKRDDAGRIVAEVKADSEEGIVEEVMDSTAVQVEKLNYEDQVPEGMVAIEDFADPSGIHREMDHFYAALNQAGSRPVRIAYYGDSFIEGDIFTADLRELLQQRFGGQGVGWVDITHIASGFRQTIRTNSSGWASHHNNEAKSYNSQLAGVNGHYFVPANTGRFTLTCQKNVYGDHLGSARVATVYYSAGSNLNMTVSLNGEDPQVVRGGGAMPANPEPTYETIYQTVDSVTAEGDTMKVVREVRVKHEQQISEGAQSSVSGVQAERFTGPINSFTLTASGSGRFYGVALDGAQGVSVDNFSSRGSAGYFLANIPEETMRQFAQVRPYDLIVIHYGLNVANAKQTNYSGFNNQIGKAIRKMKACYPNASILVVSISDRDQRGSDGQLHTMRGVTELRDYQRKLANDEHIAFWNLYDAMGGDGAMARMKENKQANLDYTHINFAGGKHVAKILFDVLMNGKENYDRRH